MRLGARTEEPDALAARRSVGVRGPRARAPGVRDLPAERCRCGGTTATFFISKQVARRSLEEKLALLTAKGIPVDDASMTELHYQLTSAENADKWISVIDTLSSKSFSSQCTNLPIVGTNTNPIPKHDDPWADQAAVEQLMSQNADTLKQLLDLAQNNGPVRYPIQTQSFNTLLPYTQNTRTAARVLQLEAILAAGSSFEEHAYMEP